MGRTIKKSNKQRGKSNLKIDKRQPALTPGLRRSSAGKKYFENRKNRSDLLGRI